MRKFWAWLRKPSGLGHGTRVNDWLTDEEKQQMADMPHIPFESWLKLAQMRQAHDGNLREACWAGSALAVAGLIWLALVLLGVV